MNQDKYVFAQLVEFLNNDKFRRLVDKYDGNRYVKHFTCWSQLLAMMFGQLSNRESLRDLIVALEAHQGKRYHLGLGREPIAKTTLASANQNRDYRIFEDFGTQISFIDLFLAYRTARKHYFCPCLLYTSDAADE